ncbi:MAG: hypothetical protein NVS3B12_08470 [Acidimicrobiales bacterium]
MTLVRGVPQSARRSGMMEPVRLSIADDLEEFVRRGELWDADELATMIARLEQESADTADPIAAMLARPFASLLWRQQMGEIPPRMAHDVEGIIYPRLWKVMEGLRGGLPDGELRTRVEVLNRRLARRFVQERP